MIFLAGGPGGEGRSDDHTVDYILKNIPGVTCYTIDHRGLGGSGLFTNLPATGWLPKAEEIIKKGPFPLSDLNLDNSALDVGLLATAIKTSSPPDIKIVLNGFSYGAMWGLQIVAQMPNTFHAVFLGGVPRLTRHSSPAHHELLRLCSQDAFCGGKLGAGSDVDRVFEQALLNITDDIGYNQCTKMLYKSCLASSSIVSRSQGERMLMLIRMLDPLIRDPPELAGKLVRGSHLALSFIMATSDCVHPEQYEEKVLKPLKPFMAVMRPMKRDGKFSKIPSMNSFVNTVIMLNTEFNCSDGSIIAPVHNTSLQPYAGFVDTYCRRWKVLQKHLGPPSSIIETVVTDSRILISASQSDLISPPQPGYSLFQKIKAPMKGFLLYASRSHDAYNGKCQLHWLMCGIYGTECDDVKDCMRRDESLLDWQFTTMKQFAPIWDLVKDRKGTADERITRIFLQGEIQVQQSEEQMPEMVGWHPWNPVPDHSKVVGHKPWEPVDSDSGDDDEQPRKKVEQPGKRVEQPGKRVEQPGKRVEQPGKRVEQPGKRVEQTLKTLSPNQSPKVGKHTKAKELKRFGPTAAMSRHPPVEIVKGKKPQKALLSASKRVSVSRVVTLKLSHTDPWKDPTPALGVGRSEQREKDMIDPAHTFIDAERGQNWGPELSEDLTDLAITTTEIAKDQESLLYTKIQTKQPKAERSRRRAFKIATNANAIKPNLSGSDKPLDPNSSVVVMPNDRLKILAKPLKQPTATGKSQPLPTATSFHDTDKEPLKSHARKKQIGQVHSSLPIKRSLIEKKKDLAKSNGQIPGRPLVVSVSHKLPEETAKDDKVDKVINQKASGGLVDEPTKIPSKKSNCKTAIPPDSDMWGSRRLITHTHEDLGPIDVRRPSYRYYSRDIGDLSLMHESPSIHGSYQDNSSSFYSLTVIILIIVRLFFY
jgi:hypothetical protein